MRTWNYRVFREDEGEYVIREVFYSEDGEIFSCTVDAVEPFGETLDELAQDIEHFKAALALPVLTLADIPASPPTNEELASQMTMSHDELRRQLARDDEAPQHRTIAPQGQRKAS